MERVKIENRRRFTPAEKSAIMYKSGNKCSHCGCKLNGDHLTIEHVIPLDKGGTNDFGNLVALCKTCNTMKDNFVCHPAEFYKYVDGLYMDELIFNQNKYYSDFNWQTPTNFFPEELKLFDIPMIIGTPSFRQQRKKGLKNASIKTTCILHKAVYSDLDNIYYYLKKYEAKYNKGLSADEKTDVKDFISNYFDNGAIYFLTSKSGEIKAVMPLMFKLQNDSFDRVECADKDVYLMHMYEPLVLYPNYNTGTALMKAYCYLFSVLESNGKFCFSYSYTQGHRVLDDLFGCIKWFATTTWVSNCMRNDGKVFEIGLVVWTHLEDYDSLVDDIAFGKSFPTQEWRKAELIEIYSWGRSESIRLGLTTPTRAEQENLVDEILAKYESIEVPLEDIVITDAVKKDSHIPKFAKVQLKNNSLKPLKLSADNELLEDYGIYLLLKQTGKKKAYCRRRLKNV